MLKAKELWSQYSSQRMAVVGLLLLALLVGLAIAAPLAPYGAFQQTSDLMYPPSTTHWLGTDNLGRDVWSRVLWGGRVSLLFGAAAAGVSLVIGVLLGSIPGYYGGLIDDVFSRFFEVFLMIPAFFLMILVVAIFGSNIYFTMVVVGLTIWPTNAKITRAQVMSLKEQGYVQAAKAAGASDFSVLLHHVIPNGIYPVVANSTLQMASAVIFEASLSFLGLGDPNQVSWGQVLKSGQLYLISGWWVAFFSGIAISLMVFAFNLVGDGINYALNPRLRQREA